MDKDAFALNIDGVENLISSGINKQNDNPNEQEGVISDAIDILDLPMTDEELLLLKKDYEHKSSEYIAKIEPRQKQNKAYLSGTQNQGTSALNNKTVPSNLLFESTATFVPQALAKNPEPVVWSDNTPEGKSASNDIKTMLQYHADIKCLRKKLGVMVWQWGVYFIAGIKHGWNTEINDIDSDVRKPKNLVFDPDGWVDEYGDFTSWLGERIQDTAQNVIDKFPNGREYIETDVALKMGTMITYTEWWTDEYCFVTYKEKVLDKHKNEFFNYGSEKTNHFSKPKKPYTFLSVFTLQEQPHDFTNLIEQNIANQDRVNKRDVQIEKNLDHGNNSILVSDTGFTVETASQAANAMEKGDPILVSGDIDKAIKRIPANPLPDGILQSQQIDKDTQRGIYGVQGLVPNTKSDQRVRNNILNEEHDSSRIGGGIGDALEQVADNIFNWWLQLYYVFYDEARYGSIMGTGRAVEFVKLIMDGQERHFAVSVSPNSMTPKDEISEQNLAMERWKGGAIDPIGLTKALNSPDPMEDAKRLVLWTTNPQLYLLTYFPESVPSQDSANPPNPLDTNTNQQPVDESLAANPASPALSNVPINQGVAMPQI